MSSHAPRSLAVATLAVACATLAPALRAQPAAGSDACAAATAITLAPGATQTGIYENAAATDDGFASPLNCLSDAGAGADAELGDVWFRVESAEETLEVVVDAYAANGDPLAAPQFLVLGSPGACGGFTLLACATDAGTGTARAVVSGLNPARVRYVLVSGADGARGEFELTVTSRPANDDPATDCATAEVLCSTADPAPVAQLRGVGAVPNESFRDGCLSDLEANTYWYKWRVTTGGTLAFTVDPTVVTDDIDFALYRLPTLQACGAKDLVACATGRAADNATGQTGLRPGGGGDFGDAVTVAADEVYALLVNATGAASGEGFALSLAGTTAAFGRADASFEVDELENACGRVRFRAKPTGAPFSAMPGVTYGFAFGNAPDVDTRTGRAVRDFVAEADGTYPLTFAVETPFPGCDDSETVNLPVVLNPGGVQVPAPVVEQPACGAGAAPTGTVTFDPPPAGVTYAYSYRRDGGAPEAVGPDPVFDNLPPGDYVFDVNALDGCPSRQFGPFTLAIPAGAVAVRRDDLAVEPPSCDSPTGTLTVGGPAGAATRSYAVDGGPAQASPVFAGLSPGEHFVDVDEVGACGIRLTFEVGDVPAAPELTEPQVRPATCEVASDGAVEVIVASSPPGPRLYALDGGAPQASPSFGGLSPGAYTVSATAGGSCPTERNVLVTVGTGAPLAEPVVAAPTCAGSSSGQIAANPADAPGSTYSLDNIDFTGGPVFRDLPAGVYTLYGRTPQGCVAQARAEIPEGEPLALEAATSAPGCAGASDGGFEIASLGQTFEYALDGGAFGTARTFDGLPAGTYAARARDTEAPFCEGVAEVVVPRPGPDAGRISLGGPVEVDYGTPYLVDGAALADLGQGLTYAYAGVDDAECVDADCQVIRVTPTETTAITVSTVSAAGCPLSGELVVQVRVNDGVYAPTAFSPNGDGVHDEWRPRLTPAVERVYAVRVYDRTGALLWQVSDPDVSGPLPGWRGTVGDDDEEAPTGVYVAVIEAEVAGLRRVITSDVTLLR